MTTTPDERARKAAIMERIRHCLDHDNPEGTTLVSWMADEILATLTRAAQHQATPSGWVMVPREPTPFMIQGGQQMVCDQCETLIDSVWSMMVGCSQPHQEAIMGNEELADLVKRLRDDAANLMKLGPQWGSLAKDYADAAAAIEALLRQSATVRARAIEEAAKVCDRLKDAVDRHPAALKTDCDISRRNGYALAAGEIRSLAPTPDLEAMVERVTDAMHDALEKDTTIIKRADGIRLSTVMEGSLPWLARAVLAAVGFK